MAENRTYLSGEEFSISQSFEIGVRFDAELVEGYEPQGLPPGLRAKFASEIGEVRSYINKVQELGPQTQITKLEIENTNGVGGNYCKITALFPPGVDPEILSIGSFPGSEVTVEVTVGVIFDSRFGEPTRTDAAICFTGILKKASQNEKGLIDLEFVGLSGELSKRTIRLDTVEGGEPIPSLVREILDNGLGLEEMDGSQADGYDPNADFNIEVENPVLIKRDYGAESNIGVKDVLIDLAMEQDAFLFVDESNVLHFVDRPQVDTFKLSGILEGEGGEEQETTEDILVNSSRDALGLGLLLDGATERVKNVTRNVRLPNGSETKQRTLRVDGPDVQQTSLRALSEMRKEVEAPKTGNITVPGSPLFSPNDQVFIPPIAGHTLLVGEYTIKKVTHMINPTKGYRMNLELGNSLASVFERVYKDSRERSGIYDKNLDQSQLNDFKQTNFQNKQKDYNSLALGSIGADVAARYVMAYTDARIDRERESGQETWFSAIIPDIFTSETFDEGDEYVAFNQGLVPEENDESTNETDFDQDLRDAADE